MFSYDNYNANKAHADSVCKISRDNTNFAYTKGQK